jgi:outer membrane protein OmpA-like peptidoglycan-associated protein
VRRANLFALFRSSCAVVAFLLLPPGNGAAQVDGPHVRIGPSVGYADWSKHINLDNEVLYGGRIGLWPNGYIGVEGHYAFLSGQTREGPRRWLGTSALGAVDQEVHLYGGNVIVNVAPTRRISPFVVAGWQEARYLENDGWPETTFENGPEAGAGVLVWPSNRVAIRAEVRDLLWKFDSSQAPDPPGEDWTNNLVYSVGIEIALGGLLPGRDTDRDGVVDHKDRCPDTPIGARVDASGCPIDSDNDGVPDGLDHCASTPAGAVVDDKGCPTDSDGDGVFDGVDQCPETIPGARVDAAGCPSDSDGDGVFDGLDACRNTPAGAVVDVKGCPVDSDGDGIPDGIDLCAATPPNAKVDATGCPIMVSEKEIELLDTGMITVRNINFKTGMWDIPAEAYPVLDEIGRILVQWPDLRIEIGGHADSRGGDAYNLELSDKRANAVRNYLLARFPEIKPEQYTARGYGEAQPVASNDTVEGRAKNRRVEFKVLNTEVLKKVRETRQMLEK